MAIEYKTKLLGENVIVYLYTTSFISDKVGWAGGYAGSWAKPLVLTTIDGGTNWKLHQVPGNEIVTSSLLVDELHGWVVGTKGLIARTDDFGNTWTIQKSDIKKNLYAIHFPQPWK